VIVGGEFLVGATVALAAVFAKGEGTPSERAFRLLCLLLNRSEPPKP
jgi:hypothetical protein